MTISMKSSSERPVSTNLYILHIPLFNCRQMMSSQSSCYNTIDLEIEANNIIQHVIDYTSDDSEKSLSAILLGLYPVPRIQDITASTYDVTTLIGLGWKELRYSPIVIDRLLSILIFIVLSMNIRLQDLSAYSIEEFICKTYWYGDAIQTIAQFLFSYRLWYLNVRVIILTDATINYDIS